MTQRDSLREGQGVDFFTFISHHRRLALMSAPTLLVPAGTRMATCTSMRENDLENSVMLPQVVLVYSKFTSTYIPPAQIFFAWTHPDRGRGLEIKLYLCPLKLNLKLTVRLGIPSKSRVEVDLTRTEEYLQIVKRQAYRTG